VADSPIQPIYVLHGTDTFLRDAHRSEIVAGLVGDVDPQLCVASFDATAELADVLDELRTLPFLAPCRIVIVRDAEAFVSAHRESLEAYLTRPSHHAALVLIVSSWPSNTRLAKRVKQIGEVRDCSAKDPGRFVQQAAGRRNKKIAPPAAALLAELIGADLAALDAEIEKLALYTGPRDTITPEDVGLLVAAAAGAEAFALTNAITAGDARAALKSLAGTLTTRGEEFKVLGMLAWHLRRALAAKQAVLVGQKPDLRMPYRQQGPFLGMLERRSLRALQDDFRRMIAADLAMKSGAGPTAAMQQLVVALCSPSPTATPQGA